MRYSNIGEKSNDNGRAVRRSALMPTIQPSLSDIYIITTPGDRLDILSYKYYGSTAYWWIIAQANADNATPVGKGTMVLPEGLQLRIPTNPGQILQEFQALNP